VGTRALEEARPLKIRAFFGVPLPETQRERLSDFIQGCSQAAPAFRWSAANLHLTVRFIGSVELDLVEGIARRVQESPGPAFPIALGELGAFRRSRLARVVWLGVRSGGDELRALAEQVERECRTVGLEPERRPYRPHLTLARARARDGAAVPDLPPLPPLEPWMATELVLYSSHPGRGRAVHEPVLSIRLSPAS
jgi:RNA 2',3'-cyclic 3'-phosphodiesterase